MADQRTPEHVKEGCSCEFCYIERVKARFPHGAVIVPAAPRDYPVEMTAKQADEWLGTTMEGSTVFSLDTLLQDEAFCAEYGRPG